MAKIKTQIMLQNKYFYVKCRSGFSLEGVTSYEIPAQLGFFGFLVEELKTFLGDYVYVGHDSEDELFQCWTSDILVTEIQSVSSVGVEEVLRDTNQIVKGVSSVGALISGIPHMMGVYPGATIMEHTLTDTNLLDCPSCVHPTTGAGGYVTSNFQMSENKIRIIPKTLFGSYDIVHDQGHFAVFYGIPSTQFWDDKKTMLKLYDTKNNKVLVNDNFKNVGFKFIEISYQ
jgi:hypothetical protein